MSKTAVYIRVSTEEQEKGSKSQKHVIQEYLKGHGIKNATWYTDRESGGKRKRPGFDALKRDIFMGKVDTVVVWALDRLTREGITPGLDLLGKWLKQGVRVISLTERWDFYGEMGEIMSAFAFWVAKQYRTRLSENTKRGLRAAQARGVKLGKRPMLFAKDIRKLLAQGISKCEAARRLGKSRQAIYDALRRG